MQNWYDTSKESEAAKWTKSDKAMACLRASLSPAVRTAYKYSLGRTQAAPAPAVRYSSYEITVMAKLKESVWEYLRPL